MTDRAWKLIRDAAIVCLAIFMLAHETLAQVEPDAIIVGAALALLGLPGTLRWDARRREQNGDG
jgi:ABC-type Fe3+-siderophore transport system permease subunit